ncbi:protein sevenless-like isoform X5 [Drosophila guanche]|uniref:protein sevenless-like isoform X5 n=1 Tax=Drosophila guanche TaxID=7266 RepID=UPI001471994D|nr:protein sevenless-like isoform X5 [Drosophila guanche]
MCSVVQSPQAAGTLPRGLFLAAVLFPRHALHRRLRDGPEQILALTAQRTQPQFVQALSQERRDSSVTIKWAMHLPEHYLSSRPFNIQYQYADLHNEQNGDNEQKKDGVWFNLADYDCDEYYVCEILEPLMPYTQYRANKWNCKHRRSITSYKLRFARAHCA